MARTPAGAIRFEYLGKAQLSDGGRGCLPTETRVSVDFVRAIGEIGTCVRDAANTGPDHETVVSRALSAGELAQIRSLVSDYHVPAVTHRACCDGEVYSLVIRKNNVQATYFEGDLDRSIGDLQANVRAIIASNA